jgi:hypothetical protein
MAPATQTNAGVRQNAIISNGTVQLGVWESGNLNVPGPPSAGGTSYVGLRYVPTNNESTAPGCLCEGWGAADSSSSLTGSANESFGEPVNLVIESFVFDGTSATSVVNIGDVMRVTHDYQPSSATPNLYDVQVMVENISSDSINLLYRRVMDWDIEPTAFNEFSTMVPGTAPELVYTSANGFNSADPLEPPDDAGYAIGAFVDAGPDDHGAHFDFDFGTVPPGFAKSFQTFYGAAGTETEALAAISAVGADAYSLGQPSTPDGPTLGTPNTFIFAFGDVSSELVTAEEPEEEETDCLPGVPGLPCGGQSGGGNPGAAQPNNPQEEPTAPSAPTVEVPTVAPPPPTATPAGRVGSISAPDTGSGPSGGEGSWVLALAVAAVVLAGGGGAVLAGRRMRR